MNENQNGLEPVILITGASGQVGWELQRTMSHLGRIVAVDVNEMDLASADSIVNTIREIKPNIIVNPAAYTAVDTAEKEEALAEQVNAVAPGIIAEEAARIGAFLMHYSTDYVFDGSKSLPYTETDAPCPMNIYGATKLKGEQAIQASSVDNIIFRTSWVYAARGKNFLLSILRLAKERDELGVVDDQVGAPTWARLIAEVSTHALQQSLQERRAGDFESSIYNLVASGSTSWYGFTQEIVELARTTLGMTDLKIKNINPIPGAQYPTLAKRPNNSCLNLSKVQNKFNIHLPSWQYSLKLCMKEML